MMLLKLQCRVLWSELPTHIQTRKCSRSAVVLGILGCLKADVFYDTMQDPVVGAARAYPDTDVFEVSRGLREQAAVDLMAVDVDEGTGGPTGDDAKEDATAAAAEALAQTADPDRDLHSFEIIPEKVCFSYSLQTARAPNIRAGERL